MQRHEVASGDTLYSISRRYGVSVSAIAGANGLSDHAIRVGQSLVIPGTGSRPARREEPRRMVSIDRPAPKRSARPTATLKPASALIATASVQQPKPAPVRKAKSAEAPSVAPRAATSDTFAWPVRGTIVAGFGTRTAAGRNDGIDIAVPIGTPVRAIADGKVLYSGSEIEGFGNLILVRHANSWVSAYANSSSNLVKRGDKVRAGQTIAKSGKTGDAPRPQLHFELRRNSQPVDPTRHLAK